MYKVELSFGSYGAFMLTLMMTAAHAPSLNRTDHLHTGLMMTIMLGMATGFLGLSTLLT